MCSSILPGMPSVNQQVMGHAKKTSLKQGRKATHRQQTVVSPEGSGGGLSSHGFKSAAIEPFRAAREATWKEIEESTTAVSHQIENFNNVAEVRHLKKSHVEILEFKNTINGMKNLSEGVNDRQEPAEKKINKVEGRSTGSRV